MKICQQQVINLQIFKVETREILQGNTKNAFYPNFGKINLENKRKARKLNFLYLICAACRLFSLN